jgi:hypothetical protein
MFMNVPMRSLSSSVVKRTTRVSAFGTRNSIQRWLSSNGWIAHSISTRKSSVSRSSRMLVDEIGLSKSAVQSAVATLQSRELLKTSRQYRTAVPAHRVLRHWRQKRARQRRST